MNRRTLLQSAALSIGAGAWFSIGKPSPTRYAASQGPLALSGEVLEALAALATPTRLGIGLQRPCPQAHQFDTVTPCNALKWQHVQGRGWGDADAIAGLGLPVRAHAPLWGHPQGRTPRDRAAGFVREIAERYGEQIYAWDIVNEPIHLPYCTDLVPELVRLARELTPWASIIINEFDAIRYLPGYNDSSCLSRLIEYALEVGADGVGLQAHGHRWYTKEELDGTFNEIEAAGLICHVTEAIYRSDDSPIAVGHTSARGDWGRWTEEHQALAYRDLVAVARAHPAVESVTFWTLFDVDAWKDMPSGGLFDVNGRAKEAWKTICKEI